MRAITQELHLPLDVEASFSLLITPSAVRVWWSASRIVIVPREGGIWVGTWGGDEDRPDYVTAARIVSWQPPDRLRLGHFEYYTRDGAGIPFAADLEVEFSVRPADGGSVLAVHETGFPDPPVGDAFFASCQEGWTATLEGIGRYVRLKPDATTRPDVGLRHLRRSAPSA
jgi:uncharacterized protein YndB with AHSA1/START domain